MSVSVIIPAYKAHWCIERCLESIKRQTVQPDEVLVGIDRCNVTKNKLLKIKCNYEFLKVYWFGEHVGCYVIRNTLAKKTRFDTLMFFDADDLMMPHYIESMAGALQPNCFVRSCQVWMRDGKIDKAWGNKDTYQSRMQIALHRSVFMEMKGLEPWMCGADCEFEQRLQQQGHDQICIAQPNMVRHKCRGSLTERDDTGYESSLRKGIQREIKNRRKSPVKKKTIEIAEAELI